MRGPRLPRSADARDVRERDGNTGTVAARDVRPPCHRRGLPRWQDCDPGRARHQSAHSSRARHGRERNRVSRLVRRHGGRVRIRWGRRRQRRGDERDEPRWSVRPLRRTHAGPHDDARPRRSVREGNRSARSSGWISSGISSSSFRPTRQKISSSSRQRSCHARLRSLRSMVLAASCTVTRRGQSPPIGLRDLVRMP